MTPTNSPRGEPDVPSATHRPSRVRRHASPPARAVLAAALVAGVALPLAGCGGSDVMTPAQRLRIANDLAAQAEDADIEEKDDRAVALYEDSIRSTGTVGNWNNLGVLLLEQQNFAGAVNAFRRAAELEPTDPRPLTNIGVAFFMAGWAGDAVMNFDLALDIDPNHLPALRGSAVATDVTARAKEEDLEHVNTALLLEADPAWRTFFERRRAVLEARLRDKSRGGGRSSAAGGIR